jgi:hypothetical protein
MPVRRIALSRRHGRNEIGEKFGHPSLEGLFLEALQLLGRRVLHRSHHARPLPSLFSRGLARESIEVYSGASISLSGLIF